MKHQGPSLTSPLPFDLLFFFFSSRRRHTRYWRDWSSDVCSSDLSGEDSLGPFRADQANPLQSTFLSEDGRRTMSQLLPYLFLGLLLSAVLAWWVWDAIVHRSAAEALSPQQHRSSVRSIGLQRDLGGRVFGPQDLAFVSR